MCESMSSARATAATCACRPASAMGANGPWGPSVSGNSWGYSGTDAVSATCPAGQIIIGMTASTSLAGFNFLQVSILLELLLR